MAGFWRGSLSLRCRDLLRLLLRHVPLWPEAGKAAEPVALMHGKGGSGMGFDIVAVRAQFPYLDQRVYLNTASTGVARNGAGRAAGIFFDEMYSKGFDGGAQW